VAHETVTAIAAALTRAGSTDNERLVEAFRGLRYDGVFGPVEFRAIDHQSTLGAFVGRTALRDGRGRMVDWRYADGRDHLPSDDVVRTLRPRDA
jgi:branched-chain amino acid transport system substrate-binding protein